MDNDNNDEASEHYAGLAEAESGVFTASLTVVKTEAFKDLTQAQKLCQLINPWDSSYPQGLGGRGELS